MGKICADAAEACLGVRDGMTLLFGGFGLCGIPENSVRAVLAGGATKLTVVSNNAGIDDYGLGLLLAAGRVRKMVSSYVGENSLFSRLYLSGALEVEFTPQGSLAERLRAGGAGIPAFYTPTGVRTEAAEGKETRTFGGRDYVLEQAIRGDFAFVRAWKADPFGNLIFRKTARNFNPLVATAGRITVVEAEEIVGLGDLDPDHVHLPGIYVKKIFRAEPGPKRIENRTVTA